MQKVFTLQQVITAQKRLNYQVFESPRVPYNLNIVGIRAADPTSNTFNDQFWVFWPISGGRWEEIHFPITADPGTYWLRNPMNISGTGILKPGHYPGMWAIGIHKTYEALVQVKPCILIRDNDKDGEPDLDTGKEEKGLFGVNFHHAGENSQTVDKWSAGCQVTQRIKDFDEAMNWYRKARNYWGNSFTYTLLKEEEI